MTSFPASVLGLSDRGVIASGMKADLLVFDPSKVRETASYLDPHQLAEGFGIVIVNGQIVRENGALSDTMNRSVLSP